METRHGVQGTVLDGVFFTESAIAGAMPLRHAHVEISRQNSNLTEVKARLAAQVSASGGDALMNFRYGQKKHPAWQLVLTLKWDTESWHGEGDVVRLRV
jgi:hypothetical protein